MPSDNPKVVILLATLNGDEYLAEQLQSAGVYKGTVAYPNSGLGSGLKLVAEGVETEQQLLTLRHLGCAVAQLVSRVGRTGRGQRDGKGRRQARDQTRELHEITP